MRRNSRVECRDVVGGERAIDDPDSNGTALPQRDSVYK
jgi:hypothetical protein